MKRRLAMLGLAATLLAPALAPIHAGPMTEHKSPEEKRAKRLEKLTKKLTLSSDQQAKVKQILDEQGGQIQNLRAQIKTLREGTVTKIEGVLTDDQKKKYADMRAKAKRHHDKK
jgi:periplasmic protein CpxP/Spy